MSMLLLLRRRFIAFGTHRPSSSSSLVVVNNNRIHLRHHSRFGVADGSSSIRTLCTIKFQELSRGGCDSNSKRAFSTDNHQHHERSEHNNLKVKHSAEDVSVHLAEGEVVVVDHAFLERKLKVQQDESDELERVKRVKERQQRQPKVKHSADATTVTLPEGEVTVDHAFLERKLKVQQDESDELERVKRGQNNHKGGRGQFSKERDTDNHRSSHHHSQSTTVGTKVEDPTFLERKLHVQQDEADEEERIKRRRTRNNPVLVSRTRAFSTYDFMYDMKSTSTSK